MTENVVGFEPKPPVFPDPLRPPDPPKKKRRRKPQSVIKDGIEHRLCATCGVTRERGLVVYEAREVGSSFFDRRPGLLAASPTVYKVSTRNTDPIMKLGWFVADPRQMPTVESRNVRVIERKRGVPMAVETKPQPSRRWPIN